MKTNEYLESVLAGQTLADDSAELKALQTERAKVERLIRDKFGSAPTIRYGGSKAKKTLIKDNYDLDIACYFACDSTVGGDTLEAIYTNVRDCLTGTYSVEEKRSALRLRSKDATDFHRDFHIDVVPGRFTDDAKADTFIYQKSAEKCRLKTNLTVHVEHIRDSGVVDAIRLLKLWKSRRGLNVKQFAFELMIAKLLAEKKKQSLADQLTHVWTEIGACDTAVSVQDPANPTGNDLTGVLEEAWPWLRSAAETTLSLIENSGWEPVFGKVEKPATTSVTDRAYRAAASVSVPNRPWCPGE